MKNILFIFLILLPFSSLQANEGSSDIGQMLITYSQNKGSWPLVHYAIVQGRPDVAEKAVELYPEQVFQRSPSTILYQYRWSKGDDELFYFGEEEGMSPLELAIKYQFADLTEKLLDLGASPNESCFEYSGVTCTAREAWVWGLGDEIIKIVTKQGDSNHNIRNSLYWAIQGENLEIIEILLSRGANLKAIEIERKWNQPQLNRDALPLAAEKANDPMLKKLIYHQAIRSGKSFLNTENDIDAEVIKAYRNYLTHQIPELLAAMQADDYNAFTTFLEYGSTPTEGLLAKAVKNPDSRYILLLLEQIEDPSPVLDEAVKSNQYDLTALLVAQGIRSSNALSLSIENHQQDIFNLLFYHEYYDTSALYSAVRCNEKDMLLKMVDKYGIDDNTRNELTKLALSLGHNSILNVLLY